MKRSIMDFWLGIFVVISIACIAFLSLKVAHITNFTNQNNYTLYAEFANIGSLNPNAPVKISGFTIGRVSAIGLNPDSYQARVTMTIDNAYKFSSDTSAQILTTGLLGEQYIGLQPGSDESWLKNGDTITLTSSAMVLEQLISKFMTNFGSK
jgi:phospholipid/cholesterol/gamma-HCH transport system substrate-binding protein